MKTCKEYQKDDLIIIWKPERCVHSGVCVKKLPEVYDPKGSPWIRPENASLEALKNQIEACPSKALSYRES